MGVEIKRHDNSDAVKKLLEQLGRKEVRVGFFEHSKYPDGTPIAYVAAIQEFGYGPIPPRPFMRPAEQQNKEKWVAAIARGTRAAIDGSVTIDHALEQIGMVAAADVRKAIKAVTAPALSPLTLLLRKHKRQEDAEPIGGKLVGAYAKQSQFTGPQPKQKKSDTLAGISTKPLVDTGQMIQAVTSVVVTE